MDWLTTWSVWHWMILGFILLIGEIILPGIFLLWWGIAAIITAAIMALVPSISLTILGIFYAILAFILSLVWWKYQHRKDAYDEAQTVLNQRQHAMLGATGIVQEFADTGVGRGYFGDTTWRIQGVELQVGDRIEVVSVQGITLKVRKLGKI
ncbi:NfeD family protein [Pasteurella bettyae]|uniref:Nodulation efficiency protein NfeD n=1 Tax=Pasteurella bettyae CCUG 2042 TaxID=1095749 RepID=I3DAU2_9PAST|nr:NfeD family protein [Pasteurella bettyae]EIJ68835.1 nodulation efficiency protein NfeD [Pasteurella bettyae CCUG 2042]SUB20873.1 nodulation efficiency, NfeD family protein [Pasteurella bettyae]